MKVVLIRHGESEANFENYWTGWLDVSLTEKGRQQAWAAGEQIKTLGITFDFAFASVLQRTIITCDAVLEASNQLWVPVIKTWRLNERHYGQLVGSIKVRWWQSMEKNRCKNGDVDMMNRLYMWRKMI